MVIRCPYLKWYRYYSFTPGVYVAKEFVINIHCNNNSIYYLFNMIHWIIRMWVFLFFTDRFYWKTLIKFISAVKHNFVWTWVSVYARLVEELSWHGRWFIHVLIITRRVLIKIKPQVLESLNQFIIGSIIIVLIRLTPFRSIVSYVCCWII